MIILNGRISIFSKSMILALMALPLKSYRTDLLTKHQPLRAMSDLADAARHRMLERDHKPPRVVTLSTDDFNSVAQTPLRPNSTINKERLPCA
jgi:hypothetical protein